MSIQVETIRLEMVMSTTLKIKERMGYLVKNTFLTEDDLALFIETCEEIRKDQLINILHCSELLVLTIAFGIFYEVKIRHRLKKIDDQFKLYSIVISEIKPDALLALEYITDVKYLALLRLSGSHKYQYAISTRLEQINLGN